jgi:hypothetical protein
LHRAIAEINHADRIQSRDNELHASRLSWLCCRSINTTIRGWLQHTGQIGRSATIRMQQSIMKWIAATLPEDELEVAARNLRGFMCSA